MTIEIVLDAVKASIEPLFKRAEQMQESRIYRMKFGESCNAFRALNGSYWDLEWLLTDIKAAYEVVKAQEPEYGYPHTFTVCVYEDTTDNPLIRITIPIRY